MSRNLIFSSNLVRLYNTSYLFPISHPKIGIVTPSKIHASLPKQQAMEFLHRKDDALSGIPAAFLLTQAKIQTHTLTPQLSTKYTSTSIPQEMQKGFLLNARQRPSNLQHLLSKLKLFKTEPCDHSPASIQDSHGYQSELRGWAKGSTQTV